MRYFLRTPSLRNPAFSNTLCEALLFTSTIPSILSRSGNSWNALDRNSHFHGQCGYAWHFPTQLLHQVIKKLSFFYVSWPSKYLDAGLRGYCRRRSYLIIYFWFPTAHVGKMLTLTCRDMNNVYISSGCWGAPCSSGSGRQSPAVATYPPKLVKLDVAKSPMHLLTTEWY